MAQVSKGVTQILPQRSKVVNLKLRPVLKQSLLYLKREALPLPQSAEFREPS